MGLNDPLRISSLISASPTDPDAPRTTAACVLDMKCLSLMCGSGTIPNLGGVPSRTPLQKRKRIRDHLAHVRCREPQAFHHALDAAGDSALVQDDGCLYLHALHGAGAL